MTWRLLANYLLSGGPILQAHPEESHFTILSHADGKGTRKPRQAEQEKLWNPEKLMLLMVQKSW